MKPGLLELRCCPKCSGLLSLTVFSRDEGPSGAVSVEEGILSCLSCGRVFPIREGVPRLYLGAISEHRDFMERHHIPQSSWEHIKEDLLETRDHKSTRQSFSREWHQFQYGKDRTFDWDMEERKPLFLEEMGLDAKSLQGKTLLDAGCGNGALTSALTRFGLQTVGMDQSDSVVRAHRHNTSGLVHFVQGDVMRPPFRKGVFDLIYSSGVLHHTPDTRKSFNALTKLVNGGGRAYVWLYGKSREDEPSFWDRTFRRNLSILFRDKVTTRLPSRIQYWFFVVLALFRKTAYPVLTALRIRKLKARKFSEEMAAIYDFYSPRYQYLHNPSEVSEWFAEEGFENITLSETWYAGFGIYGDLRKQ